MKGKKNNMEGKKSEGFNFNIKEPDESEIKYKLIRVNHYLGEETTVSISLDFNEALQKFLRRFIKMIKKEWRNPQHYFTHAIGEEDLVDKMYDINSWKDFFELIDTVEVSYESWYYIDIIEKGKGYNLLSEIKCIKKIYSLDNEVLDKYLPFV